MRSGRWMLWTAIALIAIGVVGIAVASVVLGSQTAARTGAPAGATAGSSQYGGYSSAGERIYYTAVGHAGPIAATWTPPGDGRGMMGGRASMTGYPGMGCVACHGGDGRGGSIGMMGVSVQVPDIRYSTLTASSAEASGTAGGWTDAQIAAAIRDGVDPDEGTLSPVMPRWRMDATDMSDTIVYLKVLSGR